MAMPRFVEMELARRATRRQRDQQAFFGRRQQQRRVIAREELARRTVRRAKSALLCQVVAKQIEVRAIGDVWATQKIDLEQHVGQLAGCALACDSIDNPPVSVGNVHGNESMLSQQIMRRANLRGWRRDTDVPQSLACKHFRDQERVRARAHASGKCECALGAVLSYEQAALR